MPGRRITHPGVTGQYRSVPLVNYNTTVITFMFLTDLGHDIQTSFLFCCVGDYSTLQLSCIYTIL